MGGPDTASEESHQGAGIVFGQDGKLYISTGDTCSRTAPRAWPTTAARSSGSTRTGRSRPITRSTTAPGPNKDDIWARGLRNPYRLSVDPVTGRLYIGEVGGNDDATAWEEVNIGIAGANYGWPLCEGVLHAGGITDPFYAYPHNVRDAAITGGFVYRGSQFPSDIGKLLLRRYAQNTLKPCEARRQWERARRKQLLPVDGATDGTSIGDPVKFTQGPDGSVYYVDIGFDEGFHPNPSAIRRIRYTLGNQPPMAAWRAQIRPPGKPR